MKARGFHRCDDDGRVIMRGGRYVRQVAFPGSEINGSDKPWVLKVCLPCWQRCGRPVPDPRPSRRGDPDQGEQC